MIRTPTELKRPRSFGEIVLTALQLIGSHPVLFLTLAVAVVAPHELVVLALTNTAPLQNQGLSARTFILALVQLALVGPLISALYVQALLSFERGERPTLPDVAVRGVRVLPVVAAAQIIAGIAIFLGTLAFVIPGVILALRFSVVAPVAAAEGTDWPGALARSGQLARGSYLRIFAVVACVNLVNFGLATLGIAIAGNGNGPKQVIVGIAAVTLSQALGALAIAVLYFDLLGREARRG